ncbi:uncharacterized protein LOC123706687 [Pieris brassicae]|uniref:PWWP domain-containing protein n=1 Tax=Pieris brassicae TaxID=7116 RepID=A0A9P0TFB8_PIEBR|nr:uncharacterized protein LOC123706687 [Pieris brassicae]CAH4022309.1 unnamed protein product [Pieris brassicae]
MCDQTEVNYADGDVVWVKLGSCFWPGEVVGIEKLPADFVTSFKKPPIAVVKFFQEDTYEYVKNHFAIYKYECSRKNEFILKGLDMYRKKHGPMEKFPEDVIRAETAVGGDIEILTRDEFQETKKESYADLFADPRRKTPASAKKGKNAKGRSPDVSKISTPIRKFKEKPNYQVHILVQGSKIPNVSEEVTPSTSRAGSEPPEEKPMETDSSPSKSIPSCSTPTMSSSGIYACHSCPFSTSRLNVLILHNKTHSTTFTPYIPTPIKKKPLKSSKSPKSASATSKSSKPRKPRQDKIDKETDKKGQKREAENNGIDNNLPDAKKVKTDEEIKSSLLADWDDGDEDSNEEETIATASSPDVPVAAGSPAVPTSAELPTEQVSSECEQQEPTDNKKAEPLPSDKPESSNDAKYDFCEDEDWPVEADVGRKIPRVKPLKRKEDTKSLSIDENDVAREVAELLTKTNVPELPSAPEPLKVEENFPEPSIVKSPDKKTEKSPGLGEPPEKKVDGEANSQKPIFKTKTFFRSRHSRSQDAIGKYVAEQLNAAERLDMLDNDINGSEMSPSPEPIISPPIEHVKVARLAPKIQLKKMNAEAAQLREKEKYELEKLQDGGEEKGSCNEENLILDTTIEKINTQIFLTETNLLESFNDIPLNDVSNTDSSENISTAENLNTEVNNSPEASFTEKEQSNDVIQSHQECTLSRIDKGNVNEDVETAQDNCIEAQYKSYMSESTASAVDALLSVSREADRVTKVISVDPPEDLFEDDHKESALTSNINTFELSSNGIDNEIPRINSPVQQATEINTNTSDKSFTSEKETIQQLSEPHLSKVDIQMDDLPKTDDTLENNEPISEEIKGNDKRKNENDLKENDGTLKVFANTPSESDLQIAEALINLPSTTMQNKVSIAFTDEITSASNLESKSTEDVISKDTIIENFNADSHEKLIEDNKITTSVPLLSKDIRFESEEEKSENLNAAQSLVQMSESIDHKINILEVTTPCKENSGPDDPINIKNQRYNDKTPVKILNESVMETDKLNGNTGKIETTSKLLKILEEPSTSRVTITNNAIVNKKVIVPPKGKILNTHVNKSVIKPKQVAKQQIIIRRTTPSKLLNNVTEVTTADKIILSRTNKATADGSAVQSYTIQTTPNVQTEKNTIIIQPKIRKITKTAPKLQKIKPQLTSLPTIINNKLSKESGKQTDTVFDINSMPIVLSDDVLTPESIENMPIVMSDGNIITSSSSKVIKNKKIITSEKITVTSSSNKQDNKGISTHHIVHDVNKLTPNILSKSSKLRSSKTMLVIDKATGKQKLIMTKSDAANKGMKQPQKLIHTSQNSPKTEKFVILPKPNSPRPARTQKIVIDPQTGKAHVVVEKGPVNVPISENKPVSAKLIPSSADSKTPGSTVMIITNEQGTQSRIVLTPEHEKILFPNKQQPNVSQLKTITHLISTNASTQQKSIITSVAAAKTPTRIVSKPQKSAIITSKGQLIVGGRLAPSTQNIAPLPEIRPATKRLAEPKKIAPMIQKQSPEPLIFLQKSGTVMQLTASQFEHLQRTGQIIQKVPAQEKVMVQKTITMSPSETIVPAQKPRARKQQTDSAAPTKKIKHEINIAPAPPPVLVPAPAPALIPVPVPALTPICSTTTNLSLGTNVPTNATSGLYSNMDNFEELLPTTAIARPAESVLVPTEQNSQALAAPLSDGQLLAVPGEHFGGPQGSFYLCVEENGTFTAIDNRPLVLENNQLVPMPETIPIIPPQPERRDILEAALANSDVFHAESTRDEAPDFRDLNANVSVHCRVSETSTTLNQPIMTPVELPSKVASEPAVPSNLDDGLAVIGVTPHTVPTSLELPITVTDPRIAPKTTDPLSNSNYRTSLLPSPSTEMTFSVTEDSGVSMVGPISMPLLTEEESVGKSMPILIDEITERTISSVESTVGSPSSIDIRESETEDCSQWPRRLLTPGSDISETSVEIPLQPSIQLSVSDLSHNNS